MDVILENWFYVLALACILYSVASAVKRFLMASPEEQLKKVREWLLYAVTLAEKDLGGGTGKLKLRYVYEMFLDKFPFVAEMVSFEKFSLLVDDTLEEMRAMLDQNKAVADFVSGEAAE